MKESDAAQIKCEKAIFECDVMRKEKLELQNENSRLSFDLRRAEHRIEMLEASAATKDDQLRHQYEALERQGVDMMGLQQEREKLINSLEFERTCRLQDVEVRDAELRDLQDQLGEYEEESMKLQNELYQMKLEVTRLQNMQPSPAKSVMSSKISRAEIPTPKQAQVSSKAPTQGK